MDVSKKLHEEILELIGNSQVKKAIKSLQSFYEGRNDCLDIYHELALHSARLSKLEDSRRKGFITYEEESLQFNRLCGAILNISANLKEENNIDIFDTIEQLNTRSLISEIGRKIYFFPEKLRRKLEKMEKYETKYEFNLNKIFDYAFQNNKDNDDINFLQDEINKYLSDFVNDKIYINLAESIKGELKKRDFLDEDTYEGDFSSEFKKILNIANSDGIIEYEELMKMLVQYVKSKIDNEFRLKKYLIEQLGEIFDTIFIKIEKNFLSNFDDFTKRVTKGSFITEV